MRPASSPFRRVGRPVVGPIGAWQHSAVEATSLSGVRAHAAWTVLDQIVSSGSNAILPVVAISVLAADAAGRLSVLLSLVFFALGVCRSLVGETFLLSRRPASGEDLLNQEMLGTALVLGLVAGIPVAIAALALLHARWAALAVTVGFGAIVLQDAVRYAFFSALRARRAVVSDLTWLLAFLVIVLAMRSRLTPVGLMLGWIVAGSVAGGVGVWQLRSWPAVREAPRVLRRLARLGAKIGAEYVAVSGLPQVLIAIVGLSGEISAAGPYRLATTLLTPAGVVVAGVVTALQPVCVRCADQPLRLRGYFLRAAGIGSAAVALCTLVVVASPAAWGQKLFGGAIVDARRLCVPLGVAGMAQSTSAAANLVLRTRGRVIDAVRVRFGFGLACLVAAVPVAQRWGGSGVAWLYAAGSVASAAALLLSPALRFRVSAR